MKNSANGPDEDDYESSGEAESDGDNREDGDDKPTHWKQQTRFVLYKLKKKSLAFPESNFVQLARFLDILILIDFSERRLCRLTC